MTALGHILGLLGHTMIVIDHPELLEGSIKGHEGLRLSPYKDTTGNLTVGYGHNCNDVITEEVAEVLLASDIGTALAETTRLLPWVADIPSDARKRAFVELVYNMGEKVLGFHNALACARRGDWPGCVAGFHNSLWDKQVGHRAADLEALLLTGTDPL